ncbi:MAG: CotH kinase family protein [Planctomycetes bacterium]|nr:CotH kinase family protein [Planctomycetota bacterium]
MRAPLLPIAVLAAVAGIAVVAATATNRPTAAPGVPRVGVSAPELDAMLAAPATAEAETKGTFVDEHGELVPVKLGRRGFSSWHRGDAKPSLRIEQAARRSPLRPRHVELSRPEDPLALANLLPDRLLARLGLPHAGTEAVELLLDGDSHGVYLRSLRPGDDLATACALPRGTFWKGDALGERRHEDLWADPTAWRDSGRTTERSRARLAELLALLRAPASADNQERLAGIVDLDATARTFAVQALVASNHADRAHNHVWYFDPTRDTFVPLLWDANAFGMHAEPDLPVDLARHPLGERLLCDPPFLARRDAALHALLLGHGSPERLVDAARRQLAALQPVLAHDPEIVRLVLRHGEFRAQRVATNDLDDELDAFTVFVQSRARFLRAWLADARVAVEADTAAGHTRVTVFGNVAVQVARRDGTAVVGADGRTVAQLWPGRSAERFAAPQRADQDGKGVAAPHARPAPLVYRLRGTPAEFVFHDAIAGTPVQPSPPPASAATCSIHPWARPAVPTTRTFGPGTVEVSDSVAFAAATAVTVVPGTRVEFAPGACWHVRGTFHAIGTADAPIELVASGGGAPLRCCGDVRIAHVRLHGPNAPLLALHGSSAELEQVTVHGAAGNGLEIEGGTVTAHDLAVSLCRGHGLCAGSSAQVHATASRFAFNDHGVFARDAAAVTLQAGELVGNMVGAFAEGSPAPAVGGTIGLERVTCRDNGRLDADASGDGDVRLVATTARVGANLAAPRR